MYRVDTSLRAPIGRAPRAANFGPCPTGRIGYPCFRPTALPITVISAVAPSNNGPGGGFAYARGADQAIPAAASWDPRPRWSCRRTTVRARHDRSTRGHSPSTPDNTSTDGAANQNWKWADTDDCLTNLGTAARNVYFTFTVSARTRYHFDTVDSQFAPAAGRTEVGTLLYLYRAGGAGVACNHQHFAGKVGESSLDGVLDPGTYSLVVDGYYGSEGQYLLHVNAMPDSPTNVPPAVPNYAEALSAYQSLGERSSASMLRVTAATMGSFPSFCRPRPRTSSKSWRSTPAASAGQGPLWSFTWIGRAIGATRPTPPLPSR